MYTKGKWIIDGEHIVALEENSNSNLLTICDFSPETEYSTVSSDRGIKESLENAKLICKAPEMFEAIKEVLELLDGNGVPNIEWIKNRLTESINPIEISEQKINDVHGDTAFTYYKSK